MKSLILSIIFLVAYSVCSGETASSTPDINGPTTLEQYISTALANNAGVKAAYQQFVAVSEQITQEKALPDPRISYGYATENTPQRSTFEFMQEFPWFGTIGLRTEAASFSAKSAYKKYEAKKLEVLNDLKKWFYEYSYLAQSIEITTENMELVRHFEKIARTRYGVSATTHPDIIKTQIALATLEDNLRTLNAYRQPLATKLNSILNRPAGASLAWPKGPEFNPVNLEFGQVYSLIVQNNPDLKALGYDIDTAGSNRKLAGKRFYPDLGVGVSVDEGMGRNMGTRIMPIISITLPIWRENYKAGERQAVAMMNRATQEKQQMQNTLAAQAQQMLFEFDDSIRKINLYRDILIPKAKEQLLACESAYQSGSVDFLTLIDAQRSLLDYQLLYERSLADNAQKLAELEMLSGTELYDIFKEQKK